jgi:hypothetical protein
MGDNTDATSIEDLPERAPVSAIQELANGDVDAPTNTHQFAKSSKISPNYPKTDFQLEDRYIDEPRSLRVVVIGAGLAGITSTILLQAKVPGIQLTVFEKSLDVAGTWYENKYPGVVSSSSTSALDARANADLL